MRIVPCLTLAAGAALFSTPAFSQTETPPAPATAPAPAPAPAAAVTDDEVNKFATAIAAVETIRKDTAVSEAERQPQMAAKIKEIGLEPTRFNEIAVAVQADPALKTRVQMAMAKKPTPTP